MVPAKACRPYPQILAMAGLGAAVLLLGIHAAHPNPAAQSDSMPGMNNGSGMPGMSHGSGMHGGATSVKKFAFGERGKPGKVDRVVTVAMGDVSFDPSALRVTVGDTVRFVVTNKSEIDHDFTIGDAKMQVAHRAEMAEAMERSGEMDHSDDPNAVLVKAGETKELLWKFTRVGRLKFDCNIPGYFEAGMTGVISVGPKPAAS